MIGLDFAGPHRHKAAVAVAVGFARKETDPTEIDTDSPIQSRRSSRLMDSILLGLGANLGDRAGNLDAAVAGLARFLHLTAASPIYETAPMYVEDQSPFLNMVVAAETGLPPEQLLASLKQLERRLGRVAGVRNGPRAIDLDILLYGDRVMTETQLEIPHPRMAERAFVLVPAADIAPDRRHPLSGRTIAQMAADLPDRGDVTPWTSGQTARRAVG